MGTTATVSTHRWKEVKGMKHKHIEPQLNYLEKVNPDTVKHYNESCTDPSWNQVWSYFVQVILMTLKRNKRIHLLLRYIVAQNSLSDQQPKRKKNMCEQTKKKRWAVRPGSRSHHCVIVQAILFCKQSSWLS